MIKYSQIKEVKLFCDSLFSEPNWRDVVEKIADHDTQFEVDNVRFIRSDVILDVLTEELADDAYMLGCFKASFLADVTNWPVELIQAAQKREAFEALGDALINEDKVTDIAEAYASADGYGHHFNSYDFGEEELTVNLEHSSYTYHVFDNH